MNASRVHAAQVLSALACTSLGNHEQEQEQERATMIMDASDEQAAVHAAVGNEQATNDQVVGDVGGGASAVVGLEGVEMCLQRNRKEDESQHTAAVDPEVGSQDIAC